MRILSRRKLREFWESRTNDAERAERTLSAWWKIASHVEWSNWGELKKTFGSADRIGNCVVFDVGNNDFRLIARVNFRNTIIYILKVMDHKEYLRKDPRNRGKSKWEDECGCHQPPPKP